MASGGNNLQIIKKTMRFFFFLSYFLFFSHNGLKQRPIVQVDLVHYGSQNALGPLEKEET